MKWVPYDDFKMGVKSFLPVLSIFDDCDDNESILTTLGLDLIFLRIFIFKSFLFLSYYILQ